MLGIQNIQSKQNRKYLYKLMTSINIQLECYAGIYQLLKYFKNETTKTALVTNGVPEIQRNKLKCLNISKLFDTIIIAKEYGYQKPDKDPFILALEKTDSDSQETLFIGDHYINDIQAAQSVGLHTLWIDHLNVGIHEADYIITDPNKLPEILNKL